MCIKPLFSYLQNENKKTDLMMLGGLREMTQEELSAMRLIQ